MSKSEHHTTHREVELLGTLRSYGGSARTTSLAEALNVSEETVRRTVKALSKAGMVQRVHGGVYLSNTEATTPVESRLGKRSDQKVRIAEAAAKMIPNSSSVFLDVGSTTAYVADHLNDHYDLTVITNSLHVAQHLVGSMHNRVFLAGGELSAVERGSFGPDAIAYVERFSIDTAIISIDGFDEQTGFLLAGADEADLARAIARRARRTIVVCDDTKFGQRAPIVACNPCDVDIVLTNNTPGKPFRDALKNWEVELITLPAKKKKTA